MHKRFTIICLVLTAAMAGLYALGSNALRMHAQSLQRERQNQFISVAEQIRLDIKRKLDEFVQAEQKRPYTDYLPVYVPETTNETAAYVRSPLADSLSHGLAYGHFQIDSDGNIILPCQPDTAGQQTKADIQPYLNILRNNLLPALAGKEQLLAGRINTFLKPSTDSFGVAFDDADRQLAKPTQQPQPAEQRMRSSTGGKQEYAKKSAAEPEMTRSGKYPVRSLEEPQQQQTQVLQQTRQAAELNIQTAVKTTYQEDKKTNLADSLTKRNEQMPPPMQTMVENKSKAQQPAGPQSQMGIAEQRQEQGALRPQTVQIRIEPFVPILVPYPQKTEGIFEGQVFLLRHVQIEKTHLVQGFELNETELLSQVKDSANRFLRRGMGVAISRDERPDAAYTAILDFDFGQLGLHLLEQDPAWITHRVSLLSNWFYAITFIVALAVILAMLSLWRSLSEQLRLSKKKDDFISAVSHELRTPLTSIRMYAEMLEKEWVPTEQKRREYYAGMRQETERLSRLIENVLDFSRIQRGKKHYQFVMGDLNDSLMRAVQLMEPCVKKAGFELHTEYAELEPFAFDRDAVTQIVINLIDNACKYARPAADNRVILRTKKQNDYVLIEIEDHGPGVPRREQARIFDAFYRCADESTRQTTGTGLGLALVKRFAEAHRGFVQLTPASPSGCIFRVALSLSKPLNT